MCLDTGGVGVFITHTAGVVVIHDAVDEVVIKAVVEIDEQLADLFVDAH